jgi:hypothetical protein
MKKTVVCRVRLVPVACRLDDNDRELPQIDDDWTIDEASTDGVQICNSRTAHTVLLGKDHIHHFTTNPDKSPAGVRHGFLTLNVQVFLQDKRAWVCPNAWPGQRVSPHSAAVIAKWVDSKYPVDSGLEKMLEASGYSVRWCSDPKLLRSIDLEGWEVVVERDAEGIMTKFRLRDRDANYTLIKKMNR